nr:adhesin [Mycoplasmoides pneumoniae]
MVFLFSPTLSRFSTGFNLAGTVLDQVLDYVPWIGNGYRYGNDHRGSNSSTSGVTTQGQSQNASSNEPAPTFSNVGVGLKANVNGTLSGSRTTPNQQGTPWLTLDQANLQLWTGAGWRNDKNGQSDENYTNFASATGSTNQQGSTTGGSAGNPDSLKQDKADKSGDSVTVAEATSGDNLTNYTNLPPTSPPHPTDRTRCHSPTRTTPSGCSCSCAACWAASRCWSIRVGKMITVSLIPPTKNGLTPN